MTSTLKPCSGCQGYHKSTAGNAAQKPLLDPSVAAEARKVELAVQSPATSTDTSPTDASPALAARASQTRDERMAALAQKRESRQTFTCRKCEQVFFTESNRRQHYFCLDNDQRKDNIERAKKMQKNIGEARIAYINGTASVYQKKLLCIE